MDINFHYYAVKAIAIRAGFPENEAQLIASYSQFVDDFDEYKTVQLDNVPEYARDLATPKPDGGYLFKPVTTGFNSWFDMVSLMRTPNQKWIVMPFHFFPRKPICTLRERIDWRVVPVKMKVDSLLKGMLEAERDGLLGPEAGDRSINLMKIGMLLHIFADTYAHQRFSGFWGWENHSSLLKVTNNINNADVTSSYSPKMYYDLASIGHTNLGHAPDDSNIRYEMKHKLNENDTNYSALYGRSNTEMYCDAAKEILNYLLSCRGLPEIGAADWTLFSNLLSKGFLRPEKDVPTLNARWQEIFSGIVFHYNSAPMRDAQHVGRQLTGEAKMIAEAYGLEPLVFATKSDMWFHYNVFANVIRETANGEKYRNAHHEAMMAALTDKAIFPVSADGGESLDKSENTESDVE